MNIMTQHLALQLAVGAGVGLVVIGLSGMILRRSILVVAMSCAVAVLGSVLVLVTLASARGDPRGVATALAMLALAAAWTLAAAGASLATYRRRGTENLDELRELRG